MWSACASSELDPGGDAGAQVRDGPQSDAPTDAPALPIDATADAPDDAMAVARLWRDDTAAELGAGLTFDQAVVEAYGALTPAAYYTGGLLWRASDTGTFTDGANTSWATVTALASTGRTAITRATSLGFGPDTPPSVGLTHGDAWAMWFEGEVYLDAGAYTFSLLADDVAFVELAATPTAAFQRVAWATWPNESSGTFSAPAPGWYPLRVALSEGVGDAQLQLRVLGPGVPTLQPIPRHRLRTRTSGLVGLVQAGFDDGKLVGDVEHTIDAVTPANTGWGTGNPGDLGMTSADDFSVRWSGQLRVDVPGAYTFRYVTDDGQRLWIDGLRLLDAWDESTHDQTTGAVTLTAGWHDLVIDHSERGGGAQAVLSVATGPELAGQTLPLDRLRPVEGRAERYETGVDRVDRAIPALGQAPDSAVTLVAPPGAAVTSVDISYTVSHTCFSDLEIRLIAPNGGSALVRPRSGACTQGRFTERLTRLDLNGGPAAGTWLLRVNDLVASDAGTLEDVQITVHHAGGEPPIAAVAAYESQVRDLGDVAAITRVTWVERRPTGAAVAVRVRTCAEAAGCAGAPWSAPLGNPAGGVPAVTPRRFAQYRVELTSDGDRAPAVDEVSIEYTVNP